MNEISLDLNEKKKKKKRKRSELINENYLGLHFGKFNMLEIERGKFAIYPSNMQYYSC
jgi:hypothetical protein